MSKTKAGLVVSLSVTVLFACGGNGGSQATAPGSAATSPTGTSGASGAGVAGAFGLNPTSGNFGNVPVGTRPAIVFTVTNFTNSSEAPVTISGPTASQFRFGGGTCAARVGRPTPIPPAGSCTMEILFVPTSAGNKTAKLTVGVDTANLAGTGTN